METPHESEGALEKPWGRGYCLVLIERQVVIRKVELDCKMDKTIPGEEENRDDGLCLTALAAFASSDSSMTASSEADGTMSCLTVVSILFLFFWRERLEEMLCHPRDLLFIDKARDFTMGGV